MTVGKRADDVKDDGELFCCVNAELREEMGRGESCLP